MGADCAARHGDSRADAPENDPETAVICLIYFHQKILTQSRQGAETQSVSRRGGVISRRRIMQCICFLPRLASLRLRVFAFMSSRFVRWFRLVESKKIQRKVAKARRRKAFRGGVC